MNVKLVQSRLPMALRKKVKPKPVGHDRANAVEASDGASTVEKYFCDR